MHKPGSTQDSRTAGGPPLGSEVPPTGVDREGREAEGHDPEGQGAEGREPEGRERAGRDAGPRHPEAGGRTESDQVGAGTVIDQDLLDLERELTVFLRRARASSVEMARSVHPDLEPAAYSLLARLAESGEQRATELAGYFGVGKATVSRQLSALVRLGLVDRTPDPLDGRAFLMRLTEEGRSRVDWVRRARRERYRRRLASLDPAEIAELARLVHKLNELEAADE